MSGNPAAVKLTTRSRTITPASGDAAPRLNVTKRILHSYRVSVTGFHYSGECWNVFGVIVTQTLTVPPPACSKDNSYCPRYPTPACQWNTPFFSDEPSGNR